jgi:YgiT-type zinc finger domain-containing protein
MICVICKTGTTSPGSTTVTLQRANSVIVIRDVPANICQDCGEYYLNEQVARKVYKLAEDAVQRNAEVEILHYAA